MHNPRTMYVHRLNHYRVDVTYREKSVELRHGNVPRPYHWTYRVRAEDPDDAESQAIQAFATTAFNSNVGWSREIIRLTVEQEPGPAPPPDSVPYRRLEPGEVPVYLRRRRKSDSPDPDNDQDEASPSEIQAQRALAEWQALLTAIQEQPKANEEDPNPRAKEIDATLRRLRDSAMRVRIQTLTPSTAENYALLLFIAHAWFDTDHATYFWVTEAHHHITNPKLETLVKEIQRSGEVDLETVSQSLQGR